MTLMMSMWKLCYNDEGFVDDDHNEEVDAVDWNFDYCDVDVANGFDDHVPDDS